MMVTIRHASPRKRMLLAVFALALAQITVGNALAAEPNDAPESVVFAAGKWDRSSWTPLRLPHHSSTPQLIQRELSLGTDTFTAEQKKGKLDNVLLMTDTGITEGQFEVTFTIGPERGTAPGFFLGPVVQDGVFKQGISVFVASYTMAVWLAETDEAAGETTYKHLARINRWTTPGEKHVFRCRFSKKRDSVALQVDDADVLMLRKVGCEINSKVGICGCHGTCDFYDFKVSPKGTLPWSAQEPE